VRYDEQCAQKEAILKDILWRTARIDAGLIRPIAQAPAEYAYRQRIQLKAACSAECLLLGFYRSASHDVVDINNHCPIAAQPLNSAIKTVRGIIESFRQPAQIHQIDLAASADTAVCALFHYHGNLPETLAEHLAHFELAGSGLHSLSMQSSNNSYRHISGLEKLKYSVPSSYGREIDLYFAPDSFSQINFAQNNIIVQLLLDYCGMISPASILDLYCGNGNFSLPLAGMVTKVVGYESGKNSVLSAQLNAAVNGIAHARYLCNDSLTAVHDYARRPGTFDLAIMDPPRAGADQLARELHKIEPAHLVYISCDPPTLGRDLAILQGSGFEVTSVQPVDMFPQTYHLETVVFLKAA
jgi:23S rRNA (uracil1939-C5)-methyltransferase